MGGQRKGSLKERSELEFSNQRKKLLNFVIFERQHQSENDGGRLEAVVALIARYVLLKKQHERLVNYNESRIGQSTCSEKRDFTTFFDDAERYNEQTCLALFRFKMEEIDKLVELLLGGENSWKIARFWFSKKAEFSNYTKIVGK